MKGCGCTALLVTLTVQICAQTNPAAVDYARQVHPILASRCLPCHGDEQRSGGLSLATYTGVLQGGRTGTAVRPGQAGASLLVRRVSGEVKPAMPLGLDPLAAAEIALIRTWIDQGARATLTSAPARPKWDPPLALQRLDVPKPAWPAWKAPLDRFVSAYLIKQRIAEPQLVADAVFARRVYLDVWGLLPQPEELHAFSNDQSPDKRARLIAKLLADDQKYAEHWITFWNDLLRNDEGVNYAGSRKSITPWLLASLKSNLPYDQFVTGLLRPKKSGDPDGFLVGVNWRGDISASQTPAMQAAQNSAQVFLGINLKCNSCHDSFISRWKLKDAYGLAAYFSKDPKLELYRCDAATGQTAQATFLYPELNRSPRSDTLENRRATIASIFTDRRNGRLPRTLVNRVWQRLLGRGIVEPVDEMDAEPWSPELLDWLAGDFAKHRHDLKRLIFAILTSRAYQMAAVAGGPQTGEFVFRGPEVRRMTAEQFADAVGAITGEWRVYQPSDARQGLYTREWRVGSTPLTRALGRPIRDQVVTTRSSEATTLQALELVNGDALARWLSRGARKMLDELPPAPLSRFDSRPIRGTDPKKQPEPIAFDIDVSNAGKIWLLVADAGSYEPERVEAVWAQAEFVGPDGVTPLSSLRPVEASGERSAPGPIEFKGAEGVPGVRVMTPSRMVFDISGKGFTRLRGLAAIEKSCLRDDIQPRARFFIFDVEPNMERLVPVSAETPVPTVRVRTPTDLVARVFEHAMGRAPTTGERRLAESAIAAGSAAGLADLLWALFMSPEFQLIY